MSYGRPCGRRSGRYQRSFTVSIHILCSIAFEISISANILAMSWQTSARLAIWPAAIYHVARMPRDTVSDSRQEILRTSARLFREQGYDATSMNDISAALKLSKGGLYHHFQSKDEILFNLMSHAMDITEERVLRPA